MTSRSPLARAGAPSAPARPPAMLRPAAAPAAAGRLAVRLGDAWLQRAAWTIGRTGRTGLLGLALLVAAALFFVSTHLKVASEVAALRADVAASRAARRTPPTDKVAEPSVALRPLPARTEMPAILRQLFSMATEARLAIDTGKYEVHETTRSGGLVRYQIAFPVKGPYPQIRAFIDTTLATMPEVALSDLLLERKAIGDGNVEAQIRLTVYAGAAGTPGLPGAGSAAASPGKGPSPRAVATDTLPARPEGPQRAAGARPPSDRVVPPTYAAALFAQHSWFVPKAAPPPPPPAPPPPPPAPTAPPLPYTFLGSFRPEGEKPVFFLARGDRVIDARVGDRLDGIYQLESAAGGQLVFLYLPLNVRQNLAAGVSK